MNFKAINCFLSEDNIKEHLEYLRLLRLKYSVLVKSFHELEGKNIIDIYKTTLNRRVREEAVNLLWKIMSHELFFNSFEENASIRKQSVVIDRLIYDIMTEAQEKNYGFLYVYKNKQNDVTYMLVDHFDGVFIKYKPLLCLDLYEHTYFLDYRFKKDRFLRNALTYFDFGRL